MKIFGPPPELSALPSEFPDLNSTSLTASALATATAQWRDRSSQVNALLRSSHDTALRTIAAIHGSEETLSGQLNAAFKR